MHLAPYRKTWRRLKTRQQKGAFIVLTALLLPTLVFLTGSVVDLGNIYVHHSYLQNSADAAALGGAGVGWKKQTKKLSTEEAKAVAKKKSKELIDANMSNLKEAQYSWDADLKNSKTSKDVRYYVVKMEEDVPLYFWRCFTSKDTIHIKATANARITSSGESPSFPIFSNLITFQDRLNIVNSKDKTWQGKIIHTKENPSVYVQGDIVKGSERGMLHEIDKNGKETLLDPRDKNYYDNTISVDLNAKSNQSLKDYIDDLCKNTKETPCPSQSLTEKDLQAPVTYIYDSNDQNKRRVSSININGSVGTAGSMHVLIIKEGAVNLNLNADTVGNLFIIDLSYEQLAINGGGKMNAIVYAPNSRIIWNPRGLDFHGSIVSKDVDIQSSTKSFTHDSLNIPDSGGKGSPGDVSIALSDDSDIAD